MRSGFTTLYLCIPGLKRLPTYVLTILLVAFSLIIRAQDAPILRCISLDDNDDVTLLWEQPQDTGTDFNQYLIYYRSGSTANFSILAQVTDYNQSSVLVNGSFAGSGDFYIVQVYNGFSDTSLALDTVAPIVVGISSKGKRISMGWNPSGLPSQDSIYRVYRWVGDTAWQLFRKLEYPETAVRDTIDLCEAIVRYKVETRGVGGCISRSNTAVKLVQDKEAPKRTNLLCASVDTASGHVNLEWTASASQDTYGYLVFYFEDFNRTDTIFGAGNLAYVYTKNEINALIRPETLSVAPFDSCFDSTNLWYNQAPDSLRFTTLYIDTVSFERCEGKLAIKWSIPTEGYALGVRNLEGFNVYRRDNSGASVRIGTLGPSDSIFVDSGLVFGNKYTYVVTCVDATTGKEALSNKLNFSMKQRNTPAFFYIKSVKNNHETGNNEIHVLTDTTAESVRFGLYRAYSFDDRFTLIDKFVDPGTQDFVVVDGESKADQSAFHYKIVAFDRCDEFLASSQTVQSIHVTGSKNIRDLINTVEWTGYEGFDSLGNGVLNYELIRKAGMSEVIASYDDPFMHVDDIGQLRDLSGDVCYYVKVPEDGLNSYGIQDTSVSNLLCFEYPTLAFVPNAFTPDGDGYNDLFKPYVNFSDRGAYHLIIFDRLGRVVFESNNPDEGWDGAGQMNGTFAYHLVLKNVHGEHIEQTGKIHLIR